MKTNSPIESMKIIHDSMGDFFNNLLEYLKRNYSATTCLFT